MWFGFWLDGSALVWRATMENDVDPEGSVNMASEAELKEGDTLECSRSGHHRHPIRDIDIREAVMSTINDALTGSATNLATDVFSMSDGGMAMSEAYSATLLGHGESSDRELLHASDLAVLGSTQHHHHNVACIARPAVLCDGAANTAASICTTYIALLVCNPTIFQFSAATVAIVANDQGALARSCGAQPKVKASTGSCKQMETHCNVLQSPAWNTEQRDNKTNTKCIKFALDGCKAEAKQPAQMKRYKGITKTISSCDAIPHDAFTSCDAIPHDRQTRREGVAENDGSSMHRKHEPSKTNCCPDHAAKAVRARASAEKSAVGQMVTDVGQIVTEYETTNDAIQPETQNFAQSDAIPHVLRIRGAGGGKSRRRSLKEKQAIEVFERQENALFNDLFMKALVLSENWEQPLAYMIKQFTLSQIDRAVPDIELEAYAYRVKYKLYKLDGDNREDVPRTWRA